MVTIDTFKEMLNLKDSKYDDIISKMTNVLNLFPIISLKPKKETSKTYQEISIRTQNSDLLCDVDILNLKTIYELTGTINNDFNINIINSSKMKNGEVLVFTITYTDTNKVANGYNLDDGTENLNTQEFNNSFIIGSYADTCRVNQEITLIRKSDGSFIVYSRRMFSFI